MIDLFEKLPFLLKVCKSRWLQFIIVFPTLLIFIVFLYAGIFGTPVGNKNIIIVFVWIFWWILLIGFMVPFASRIWCLVCPFPIIGEWLQRMAFIKVRTSDTLSGLKSKYFGKNKPWPKKHRHIWFQSLGFLSLAVFSPFLVTRPFVSFIVLGGLFAAATALSLIYKQRVFCMYLCPVSGFLGLYSMTSKLGLRAKDVELCNRIKKDEEFNFDYGIAACRLSCPTGMDASSYIALIGRGRYKEALEVIKEASPFAGVLGRVCTHPCETECVRKELDEPISICRLKRFVGDYIGYNEMQPAQEFKPRYKEKIAIIGAGPAGLSCAYHLVRNGYQTTVYEALPVAGGMIRVGIPSYRLPKDIVDREIEYIKNSGADIRTNIEIGRDLDFEELRKENQAIFIAVGASESRRLKIEGEDLKGVYNAIDILQKVSLGEKLDLGKRVIVIGGGDTAIDTARAMLRLGCNEVRIAYRRTRDEMPAIPEEVVAAEKEGIKIDFLTAPVKIEGSNGRATSLLCTKMRLGQPDESGRPQPVQIKGSEYLISTDSIIVATGQYSDINFLPKELSISTAGTIIVDTQDMVTNIPGIFAGGDVVSGPDILVKALGMGRRASIAIDRYLRGEELSRISFYPSEKRVEEVPIGIIDREDRVKSRFRPIEERIKDFKEVEEVFTENMAVREAKRCLSCGICGACYRGSDKGWACAWFEKMGGMDRNNYCGLCMECVKSCPYDNIGLYWRPFAWDKDIKGYDESWKSFIMLVLAIIYSINLLSPWGKLKNFLNFTETGTVGHFILLSVNMLLWCLALFPSIHYLFCKFSQLLSRSKEVETKELFLKYSYAYVPLGLMAWVCFSVPLLLINGSYILAVISDPFGWGWNLFGTAHLHWSPILPHWVPYIQALFILAGLFYSVVSVFKIAKRIFSQKEEALKSIIPIVALLLIITIIFFRLYLG
ncbi:MAG: FAD-dependent oxidoreductase [Candidatus Omnitrophota bacterium]